MEEVRQLGGEGVWGGVFEEGGRYPNAHYGVYFCMQINIKVFANWHYCL